MKINVELSSDDLRTIVESIIKTKKNERIDKDIEKFLINYYIRNEKKKREYCK